MTISSFHPPKRTLMGPGPSDVSERVLQALARPTIGHLDPVQDICQKSQHNIAKVVQGTDGTLLPLPSHSGTSHYITTLL